MELLFAIIASLLATIIWVFLSVPLKKITQQVKRIFINTGSIVKYTETIPIARILIVQTGTAKYVTEVSSLLDYEIRSRLNQKKRDAVVSHLLIDSTEKVDESSKKLSDHIIADRPDLIVTVGSTATENTYLYQRNLPSGSRVAQIFTAVTTTYAKNLFGDLSPNPLRPNISGVTFGISQTERINFIILCLSPRKVGFITNGNIKTDLQAYAEIDEYIKKSGFDLSVELIIHNNVIDNDDDFSNYDVIMGWYYLHSHMQQYVNLSSVPIFGGGAIDARSGATISLADDERHLVNATIEHLINPFFFEGKNLYDTYISSMSTILENYSSKIFVSRKSMRQLDVKIPAKILIRTSFYE